ncbi:glycosyl transferase family 2 [Tengunoibacter tsumagoiensis]|uniref:Glycosyl transferase family 2 n=1 Tax=Tengunoibacter tsumagoiensis TaxID=2014871 RepID=A0A402A0P9_9CHLR|nr:glycosyl transferase family 2 [Tengunoibacter tsumagoiensis]
MKQQTFQPKEIIVVIDHNEQLLKRAQEHVIGVSVIENTEMRGLSGARNCGIAAAQGNVIAFLDDDALATPDWLKMVSQRYTEADVLGTGGTIIPLWAEDKPVWFPEEFYWVVGCTYRGMPQTDTVIRNPIGANMSLRRDIFDFVGSFRSDIGRIGSRPIGCEETELCIRAKQHWPEGRFLYLPAAVVFHRVTKKRATWAYFCSRCYSEGLSKAQVTRFVGVKDSLAVERLYMSRILPAGVIRGIKDALFHRDLTGFARAGVIVVGLVVTTAGYCVGLLTQSRNNAPKKRPFDKTTLRRKNPLSSLMNV